MQPFLGLISAVRFARQVAESRPVTVYAGTFHIRPITIEFAPGQAAPKISVSPYWNP